MSISIHDPSPHSSWLRRISASLCTGAFLLFLNACQNESLTGGSSNDPALSAKGKENSQAAVKSDHDEAGQGTTTELPSPDNAAECQGKEVGSDWPAKCFTSSDAIVTTDSVMDPGSETTLVDPNESGMTVIPPPDGLPLPVGDSSFHGKEWDPDTTSPYQGVPVEVVITTPVDADTPELPHP